MMIGTEKEAKLIYRRRKTGYGPIPKGWKRLGSGAYRTSYLSPNRVVYKISFDPDYDDCDGNRAEYARYLKIKQERPKLPKGWRVARAHLYSFVHDQETINVIAMEYVEGTHPNLDDVEDEDIYFDKIGASKAFEMLGLFDLHEGNFLVTPEGNKVIIDLGE